MHAFRREGTEIAYLGKLIISDVFWASDKRNNPINVVDIALFGDSAKLVC